MVYKVTLLTLTLLLSIPTFVLAQVQDPARRPVSSITDAKWKEYRSMYGASPICSKDEITLWSCETTRKTFVLCSSTSVGKDSGYIQYRAANKGKIIFTYPDSKIPPSGSFAYYLSANGDATLEFSNGGYDYNLTDRLRGRSQILVDRKNTQGHISQISCKNGNQTLQVNYTMRLMFDAGIWAGY